MTAITCECCWIAPVTLSVSNNSRYCKRCRGHLYTLVNLRADHRQLYLVLKDKHAEEIAEEHKVIKRGKATIKTLTAERDDLLKAIAVDFSDGVEGALQTLIRDETVRDMEGRVQSAFRHRNHGMAAVWRIDELHHAVGVQGKCECGKPLSECTEFKALGFCRDTLYEWERRETQRMNAGQHHGLPRDHPEAKKQVWDSWDWKGETSTRPERPYRQSV